jgi:predicted signal transduction protein with EAL and GGDEF domain
VTFPGDTLARLGGDEFAVICAGVADAATAAQRAAMLLDAVRAPCRVDGRELHIASSAGITLFPAHGGTVDELVRNSDMALYAAKAAGRNTWRFFDEDMGSAARQRLALQTDLARAVELGQLELHYQPQVDMGSRRVRGFEALVRWRHPQHGLVPPSRFIPLAEECGLIVPIGNHVLRMACAEAARWPGNARIAVNVSGIQFSRSDLVREVRDALRASGLPPQRLEIEVTESVLIDDRAGTRKTLQALRELGVGVALDDFGTGYSSLVYLREYPLTKLKIDRSFVATMHSDQGAVAIVRSIVLLAQEMSLDLVAEGIETQDEREALLTLGCATGQGQLFASPMPTAELALFIADRPAGGDMVAAEAAA